MNSQLQQTKMIKQTTYDKEDCLKSAQVYNAAAADAASANAQGSIAEQDGIKSKPWYAANQRKIVMSAKLLYQKHSMRTSGIDFEI